MKRTNTCPKCGCTSLLQVKDTGGDHGISLILGWFKAVPVTRHVCTGCGYAESWVDDKHLDKLKEHYEWENRG